MSQIENLNKVGETVADESKRDSESKSHEQLTNKQQKEKDKKKKDQERSHSKKNDRRSRQRSEKKKKKHKQHKEHKSSKYRSRSRDRQNKFNNSSREKHHKRNKQQSRHKGRSRSKDRVKQKKQETIPDNEVKDLKVMKDVKDAKQVKDPIKQIPMPLQIPMPPMPGERRRRQRSRSPLGYYRRNQNNNEGEFWDSFSWVPRINYTPNVSSSALVNTKKMRRLMITNVPYEIGITEDDLRDLITRFMRENYLKDEMNSCPVVNLEINETDRNVAVELSSVEQTCRICKLDKIQLFKGTLNGIIRLGDSMYGSNVVTQAENAAKAQAAAFAAINVLQNKKTQFNLNQISNAPQHSTVIRVTNAVTPYMCSHLNEQQWQDYHDDLLEGFSQYGKIVHNWFVKKNEKDICADPGNLFIEYEYKEQAEAAISQMNGRIYDQRTIKLYYMPRDLYYKNFQKNITPPVLPTPKPPKPQDKAK